MKKRGERKDKNGGGNTSISWIESKIGCRGVLVENSDYANISHEVRTRYLGLLLYWRRLQNQEVLLKLCYVLL
jgi:hypothetical protein